MHETRPARRGKHGYLLDFPGGGIRTSAATPFWRKKRFPLVPPVLRAPASRISSNTVLTGSPSHGDAGRKRLVLCTDLRSVECQQQPPICKDRADIRWDRKESVVLREHD